MFDSQQKQGTTENGNNGKKKTARRLTEVGVAVLILAAVILIKVLAGGKVNPNSTSNVPTLYDIYQLEIPEFDGEHYVIEIQDGETFFKPDEM